MKPVKIITGLFFLMIVNKLVAQNNVNCKIYHSGFFEFEGKHASVVIYRDTNYQIEYNTENDQWVTIKLYWINDCKYSFTYIHTNMDGLRKYIGHTVDVDILTGNTEGYTYHSIYKEGGKEFDGKIIFPVTEIEKSLKKKIKDKLKEAK